MPTEKQPRIKAQGVTSYPHLFAPHESPGGKRQYSVTLIFKQGKGVEPLKKAVADFLQKTFGKDGAPPRYKLPFRDGADYADKDGFEAGDIFVPFTRKEEFGPPLVVGPDTKPLKIGSVYGGCVGIVATRLYGWHFPEMNRKGCSFSLDGYQFVRDGELLGGVAAMTEEDFDIQED